MVVKVYVEGGGASSQLKAECRRGFKRFFEKAGLKGVMPAVVACGSRSDAYKAFCTALRVARGKNELPLLLVDSEDPVSSDSAWTHLNAREGDKWQRPTDASESHVHLMVQCMESWFLADPATLERYFGGGFDANAFPKDPKIECISKQDVFDALKKSTRQTKSCEYHKGRHSFKLLAEIQPAQVIAKSGWAKRLIDTIRSAKQQT